MQNISSNQKKHLYEGGYVGVTITGETLDGTLVTVTEDDIIEGSLSIDRSWVSGSTIEIGCADTSELVFELDNTDGQWSNLRWEGARLTVVFDIAGEPLRAGIFTVDEPPRKLTTMQIKALDSMARFNRPYASGGIPCPATLLQIVQDACSKCGVTLYTQTFDNDSYSISERPEGDDITYHHVVAWVAELAGRNAWIDHLGRLRLSWYGQAGGIEIGPDDRFSYETAETDIEITGIVYRTEETDYLVGSNKYALVIEGNPLLQENYEAVLNALLAKLGGFKYRPYKFETLGYPHLWPGDAITRLVDAEGNATTSIITNHVYKLNGNSALEAKGETETVRGYATGAPFTPSQKRILQAVARVEAARQTSSLEQATLQLNELMVNSLGFYSTTVELEAGAKVTYTHDKPALEDSTVIWTRTEQGFAWTDQGWNNGSPVWQYGVTSDGSAIVKLLTAVGINAEWVHIGPGTQFEEGYDPTAIEIGGRNLLVRNNELQNHWINAAGEVVETNYDYAVMYDYITVEPGKTLTFSKTDSEIIDGGFWRWSWHDADKNFISRQADSNNEFQWVVPDGAHYIRVSYPMDAYPQIERGNKATDWTPALEDVNASIAETQAAADAAQSAADAANNTLADIANDNKLTPEEKQSTKKEWDIIVAEKPTIEAQATTYGVTTEKTTYISAYNTLNTYITPLLSSLTTTSDIVGTTFRTNFKNYYDKRALLLKAISDKAKTNLADHDSNSSPHNLPSYARMENTGFTVYDDQGNKRTHSGQYSPGEYGFWVDAGHYMLRDMGIDMSLVQLPNLIPDHSFEYLGYTSDRDQNYHDNAVKITSSINQWYDWEKIGTPRLLRSDWTQRAPVYAGAQCVAMNSSNYLRMRIHCTANAKYFLSASVARGFRNPTSGTPKIYIEYMTAAQQLITTGTHVFGINTGLFDWRRIGTQLTMPANCDHVRITFYSTNSNYVYWDGLQLVKGDKPVRYEPEESMWRHIRANVGIPAMGHVVEEDANANGFYTRLACQGQIPGLQICWYYGYKSVAINNAYEGLYQGTCPVSFPAEFTYQPAVAMGQARWGASASWGTPIDTTGQSVTLRFIDVAPRASSSIPISYIAIGRWEPDD